jgi:hypothetical protein
MAAMLMDRRLFFVMKLSSYVGANASGMMAQQEPVTEMQNSNGKRFTHDAANCDR